MALPDIIRAAVATANRLTSSLRAEVEHFHVVGQTITGPVYNEIPDVMLAIVEDIGEEVVDEAGTEALASSKLTFLQPVPIDLNDYFVMPDGSEAHVIKRAGLLDETGTPYYREVFVGRGRRT